MPWWRILCYVTLSFVILAIIGTIIGAIIEGVDGAGGFLTGVGIVYLSFLISIVTVLVGERRSMTSAARSLVIAYVVKVVIFTLLLILAPVPDGFRNGWMMVAALIAILLQLGLEAYVITKQRLLYFDATD
ncbi:Uncharacterised protein [Mycobacteroides abscessus subsp. bolletii]|nr:Uncharacterised protein [Mycobacteroides abscessus subsp. bolletii]